MSLNLKLTCTNHPRYDPMRGGEAAIRGACSRCMGLLELYRAYLNIRQSRFGQEDDAIEPHSNS
jgi:hypothetical protein